MGEAALVLQLPFASISLYANGYSYPAKNLIWLEYWLSRYLTQRCLISQKKDTEKACEYKRKCYLCTRNQEMIATISRSGAVVARWAHNPKVRRFKILPPQPEMLPYLISCKYGNFFCLYSVFAKWRPGLTGFLDRPMCPLWKWSGRLLKIRQYDGSFIGHGSTGPCLEIFRGNVATPALNSRTAEGFVLAEPYQLAKLKSCGSEPAGAAGCLTWSEIGMDCNIREVKNRCETYLDGNEIWHMLHKAAKNMHLLDAARNGPVRGCPLGCGFLLFLSLPVAHICRT